MSSLEGWNSNPKPNHIFNPIPKLKPKLLRSNDIEKMYFGAFHEIKLRTRFSYNNWLGTVSYFEIIILKICLEVKLRTRFSRNNWLQLVTCK